ncbi:MAG: hypothetical protein MZV70_29535 [Desulfobacterales bacterium]|nr:hypothetical protein [Desulfobacterales bacterium]
MTFTFPADATAGRWFETGRAVGRDRLRRLRPGGARPRLGRPGRDRRRGQDRRPPRGDPSRRTTRSSRPRTAASSTAGPAALREKGAAAVVTIIDEAREKRLADGGLTLRPARADSGPRHRQRRPRGARRPPGRPGLPPGRGPARRRARPSSGVSPDDLARLVGGPAAGEAGRREEAPRPPPRDRPHGGDPARPGRSTSSPTLEGSDPVAAAASIVTVTSHHDHTGPPRGPRLSGSGRQQLRRRRHVRDRRGRAPGPAQALGRLRLEHGRRAHAPRLLLLRPALPGAGREDQRQPQPGHDLPQRRGPPLPHRLEQAQLGARRQHPGHEREARSRAAPGLHVRGPRPSRPASSSAATSTPTSATASRACGSSAARPRTTTPRATSRPRPTTPRWRGSPSSSIAWPWTSATGPSSSSSTCGPRSRPADRRT